MLITDEYRRQNEILHKTAKYGHRGHTHLPKIREVMEVYDCKTVLDYGCGRATLSKHADFPVVNYDPATYPDDPKPCDLLVCTDVLEHIEPGLLNNVLDHMKSKMRVAYLVINTEPDRSKLLPDGTNPHKIIEGSVWWLKTLSDHFTIDHFYQRKSHVHAICRR